MKQTLFSLLLSSLSLVGWFSLETRAGGEEKARNPFGVADVSDPDGADVREFAKERLAELTGAATDANAEQWAAAAAGMADSLEGKWSERWGLPGAWQPGRTPSEVRVVGERVYILANCTNGRFLVDLKREGDRLIGRYQGIDNPADSSPCLFLIVNNQRLDGLYRGARWDFRRKLPAEK